VRALVQEIDSKGEKCAIVCPLNSIILPYYFDESEEKTGHNADLCSFA